MNMQSSATPAPAADPFVAYYARESLSEATLIRFQSVMDAVQRLRAHLGAKQDQLDMADIGCGAGTQCVMWARDGHRVHGVDINEKLVELGRERAREAGLDIDLRVGSAVKL